VSLAGGQSSEDGFAMILTGQSRDAEGEPLHGLNIHAVVQAPDGETLGVSGMLHRPPKRRDVEVAQTPASVASG
jgi:hypothetical protein